MQYDALSAAKINLFLHILGRRSDGYHLLESLVFFANIGDRLSFIPANTALELNITGPYAKDLAFFNVADNLVLIAAKKLEQKFNITIKGMFELEKKLPVASGIGGGSANAATAIKLLVEHYKLPVDDIDGLLLELGADVPVCYNNQATIMSGIGEALDDWPQLPKLNAVLVNPNIAVSTAKIFGKLNATTIVKSCKFANQTKPNISSFETFIAFLNNQTNHMQPAAIELCPQIGDVLNQLKLSSNCAFAQMSGSGATCFALYENAQDAALAEKKLAQAHPNWWVQACVFN